MSNYKLKVVWNLCYNFVCFLFVSLLFIMNDYEILILYIFNLDDLYVFCEMVVCEEWVIKCVVLYLIMILFFSWFKKFGSGKYFNKIFEDGFGGKGIR